ncbi:hypothetical protein A3Q56_08324, partial [Intoshia linei]
MVKKKLEHKQVFLVTDESDIAGEKYINILMGTLNEPHTTYLVGLRHISVSPNATMIAQIIDDTI